MTDDYTSPRIAPHHLAAAVTLLLTLGLGVWQLISSARDIAYADLPASKADILTGITAKQLETRLEENMPARGMLISTANAIRYKVFHSAGDQVRLGRDDWLFLNDELYVYDQAAAHQQARVELMAATAAALARANVHLVVALVPDKSRIYSDRLDASLRPAILASRYSTALAALQHAGVDTVDLAAPLSAAARTQAVYYRTDTHWNQTGARIAAEAIAAAVLRSQPDLPATHYASLSSGPEQDRPGDLIRLMGLEQSPAAWRPAPDREQKVTTERTGSDSELSLFGDHEVAVVLCGTSYSLRGNFQGYLQQALSSEVLNTAKDGGGFLNAITTYLQDEAYKNSPPRVLIWEVPERFLQMPLDKEPHWLASVGLAPAH